MENAEVTNSGNNPPDKDLVSSSELNPLQNPILGRNLGRWAQVYFTNPPERREQAVVDLLRELEKGQVAAPSAVGDRRTENDRSLCPVCQRESEPGQKFCGVCGAPLAVPSEAGKHDRAFLGNNPITGFAPPISPEGDAEWLREKAFASFETDHPKRQVGKYLIAIVVVAVAGLSYLGWSARADRPQAAKPITAVRSEPSGESKETEAQKPSQVIAGNQSDKKSPSSNVETSNPLRSAPG